MRLPWQKRIEKKGGDSLVQYQGGIYYIGSSGFSTQRLKDYVAGYRLCDTVYSCVNLISQTASAVPWFVYRERGDDVEEVYNNPLNDWLDTPGEHMDWTEFTTQVFSYFLTTGNCYIHTQVGSQGKYGKVEVLRPQHMTVKVDTRTGAIDHYEYRVAGQMFTFKPEEIIHVKTFNPEDPLYGLAPTNVLARKIDIMQFGELWTVALLENEARPSGALKINSRLTDDQRKALNTMLRDQFSGYNNAGKPLVLEGDWDWKSFSFTPKELEFMNSKKITMREICAAYKVAPELFGDSENKTYSNIKEARKALYQEAVIPLLDKFKTAFNRELVPMYDTSGVYLDYDVSSIDALSEDLNALWTRMRDGYSTGLVTRNEVRDEIGYGEIEGAPDVISEPMSAIITPVDDLGKEPEPEPEPTPAPEVRESLDEEETDEQEEEAAKKPAKSGIGQIKGILKIKDGYWQKPERKEAKWTAFHRRIQAREKRIEQIAHKYLTAQADRIAKEVRKAPSVQMLNQWGVLDKEKEAGLYADVTKPWYVDSFLRAVRAGLAAGKGEIFDGEEKADFWTPDMEERVRKLILESGTKIAETTMQQVMDMLEVAEIESMTVNELAQKIKATFDEFSHARARRIARTEAAKVENAGELEGYRNTEFVELKGWLCAFVELSREAHKKADDDYSNDPIELDEDFIVGGEPMAHPGDPKGGVGNVVNCLCTLYPQVKEL